MAVPRNRTSNARKNSRRSHHAKLDQTRATHRREIALLGSREDSQRSTNSARQPQPFYGLGVLEFASTARIERWAPPDRGEAPPLDPGASALTVAARKSSVSPRSS